MLSGPKSAEILARILADPESFTLQDDRLIKDLEASTMSTAPTAEQWAALSDSTRFYLAVACLKLSLAQQRAGLGSS